MCYRYIRRITKAHTVWCFLALCKVYYWDK